jgi:hypothetical protein
VYTLGLRSLFSPVTLRFPRLGQLLQVGPERVLLVREVHACEGGQVSRVEGVGEACCGGDGGDVVGVEGGLGGGRTRGL